MWTLRFGATVTDEGVQFRIWAPRRKSLALAIDSPRRAIPMQCECDGEFTAFVPGLRTAADYAFVTDGGAERPDPVSRFQPYGVHGRSRVIDPHSFRWTDQDWKGLALEDYLIYELHTGSFTEDGTFGSMIPRLGYLRDVGITAVELMPVAEFPGKRNWGYDGVAPYAPQSSYGGPDGLKELVDACHREGLAVVLDVVYNHLGPEGNYLQEFGPYFTESYRTPWGCAINYDGAGSDGVRRYFVDNALYWLTEYHVDALRLDAIHGIFDFGARHILAELAEAFHRQAEEVGRPAWVIGESDLNDVRVIKTPKEGGHGLDAQWNDDFHHSLYSLLTGDRHGYFADFGRMQDLAQSIQEGFVYDGRRSVFRRRRHGSSSTDRPGRQFVIFTENHDQIANALGGNRLSSLLSLGQQKVAAMVLLCSPFIPLLFMGQEYGETAPFRYFTDHGDAALAEAVREGRRLETADLSTDKEFADPQDVETFRQGILNWRSREARPHAGILEFYRDLIAARKAHPSLGNCRKDLAQVEYDEEKRWLALKRGDPSGQRALIVCNFGPERQTIPISGSAQQNWALLLWSGSVAYGGPAEEAPTQRMRSLTTLAGESASLYIEV